MSRPKSTMFPEDELIERMRRIRAVVSDVDGTLTDGGMYYFGQQGEAKKFNVRDGAGVALLTEADIEVIVVTGEASELATRRATKLGIRTCLVGVVDKPAAVGRWLAQHDLTWESVACAVDEINDLPLLRRCGVSFAPADASPLVRREVSHVLETAGGAGVLRELAIRVLEAQGSLESALNAYLQPRHAAGTTIEPGK